MALAKPRYVPLLQRRRSFFLRWGIHSNQPPRDQVDEDPGYETPEGGDKAVYRCCPDTLTG